MKKGRLWVAGYAGGKVWQCGWIVGLLPVEPRVYGAPSTAPFASALVLFRPGDAGLRMRCGTLVDLLNLQPSLFSQRPTGPA